LVVVLTAPGLSQLSVAVAVPVAAGLVSPPQLTVASAGAVTTGAVVSTTAISWSALALFPQSSVAVHVRVITYDCGQLPAASLSLELTLGLPSQLSVALAEPVFDGAVLSSHSTVTSAGTTRSGAVVSTTAIVCTHWLLFPQSSVAVHVRVMVLSAGQLPAATLSL
jgi:hypothetical protein